MIQAPVYLPTMAIAENRAKLLGITIVFLSKILYTVENSIIR